MNTTTTLNTNSIFDTKEQYVAFRAKWRQLYADGFHKRQPVAQVIYDYNIKDVRTVGYHQISPLTAWHHLMFNLALGRDPMLAFGNHKASGTWNKSDLYWKLCNEYGQHGMKHNFDVFGVTLTDAQKGELRKRWQAFHKTL